MDESAHGVSFIPELAGRTKELERLKKHWNDALNGKGSTVFISGEAGIGKTRLVSELIDSDDDARVIKGWCLSDNLEPLMPFRVAMRNADMSHLMSDTPPPKVISTYLINEDGILVAKAEREESGLDPDIFASMLTAVANFVSDSLSMMGRAGEGKLNDIGFGDHVIIIQTQNNLSLAVVIEGTKSEFLIYDMNRILEEIGDELKGWVGDMKTTRNIEPKLSCFLGSGSYDGIYMIEDPKLRQENLFDNVLLGLRRTAVERPVILFLDDVQWADPSTLKLLHYLARNTRENHLLILCTYRSEDILGADGTLNPLKTTMQNMSREHLYDEITLDRLDGSSVSDILMQLLGDTLVEFVDRINKESEGNPFYLLEVIRMLVEEGHLTEKNGTWIPRENIQDVHIPSRIYDVVVRRLDRLVKEQRELLECASVVGDEFESKLLGHVTGMNRMLLLKNLNSIENTHRLIHSANRKYRFDHNKIREVLYNGINGELREEYHLAVAEGYETLFDKNMDEYLTNIAHHYFTARDVRAVEYLLRAGDLSRKTYANDEAIKFYSAAMALTDSDHISTRRALEGSGDVCAVIGEYDQAEEYYEKAFELVGIHRDRAVLYRKLAFVYRGRGDYEKSLLYSDKGLAIVGDDEIERCKLLQVKGKVHLLKGEYDMAIEVYRDEMEHATGLGLEKEIGLALCNIGSVYNCKGDYHEAEEHIKEAIELLQGCNEMALLGPSWNQLGMVYRYKGELEKALECYEKSYEIFDEIGDKSNMAALINNIGIVHWIRGELEKAIEYQERNMGIVKMIGDKRGLASAMNNMGLIYSTKGELDRALEYYNGTVELVKEMDDKWGQAVILLNMAEIFLDKGDLDKSLEHSITGSGLLEKVGDKTTMATSLFTIGKVYFYKNELASSLSYYRDSLALRSEIGDKKGIAESGGGLAETLLKMGDTAESKKNAVTALSLALEVGTKNEDAYIRNILGKIHREKNRFKESEEEFRRALLLMDECGDKKGRPIVIYEQGLLYNARGDMDTGKEYLARSLSMFQEVGMKFWASQAALQLEKLTG